MAFIDDIVKFHSFSKSTVRTGLTLGEAVNPSGHTVTSKQVRTDDIPWFVNSFQGDETAARTWAAKNATAARHNDILYYGAEFKVGFTAPKCLIYVSKQEVDGKLVDLPAEQCGWQTFDLNAATTLKNSEGKAVIAIHKNAKVEYVDGNNNAATNSNQQSLFVRRADGTLLDHFVAATDQIVGGQPSLGYNAVVSVSGKAIDEGEGTGNYIGNTYAGIVHFHAARSESKDTDGSVKGITVTCFEYIGDKLDSTLGNIREEIKDIVGVTMEGVVASVGTTTEATAAGISVDSSSKTSPKIDITTGSATAGETKLVTGGTVASAIDTAVKITGIQVKVGSGAAQSLTPTNKVVTIEIPEVQAATVTGGEITTDGFAKASDAKAIAEKAIVDALAATGADTLGGKIAAAQQAAEDAQGTADEALAEAQAKVASITTGTVPDGVSFTTGTTPQLSIVTSSNTSGDANYLVTKSRVEAIASGYANSAADAAIRTIDGRSLTNTTTSTQGSYVTVTTSGTVSTGLTVNVNDSALASTVSAAASAIQGITLNGGEDNELVKVGEGNIIDITLPKNKVIGGGERYGFFFDTNEDTGSNLGEGHSGHYLHISAATYDTSLNKWWDGTTDYFTTASTVESFVNATVGADLATLESKVNAYHEAGVSYKVHTGTTLPDLSVAENVELYKNVILLVPATPYPDGDGNLDNTTAMSGGYIEYLCVNKGTAETPQWAWEQIGTTEADLKGYVRAINGLNIKEMSDRVSPVYASISSTGYLTLGIDSATSTKLGVSKMFSGEIDFTGTATDTAVSVKSVSDLYSNIAAAINVKPNTSEVVGSINGIKGAVNICVHNAPDYRYNSEGESIGGNFNSPNHANLWGMGIINNTNSSNGEDIFIVDSFVGMSSSYLTTASLPEGAASVENNFVMNAIGGVITTIRPERMVSGFYTGSAAGTLHSWVGDLSNLETASLPSTLGTSTFYCCSALTTFIGDLSSLTHATNMFGGYVSTGKNLKTFISDLSSLTHGEGMFHYCSNLEVFDADLSSLTHGNYMFYGTNLSLESIENIADSINEHEGNLTISWDTLPTEDKRQALVDELSRIVDKGWTLNTNSEILPLFDSEKYQTGSWDVQPLDLESEPQTVYYVVKK